MSTVTVTSLADSGAGSLRAAINVAAASGDTIVFGNLQGTIALQSVLDLGGKDLTITGPGRNKLTIDASATDQAMRAVGYEHDVTISDLKIIGGQDGTAGGAAFEMAGEDSTNTARLTMTNVDVTGSKGFVTGGALNLSDANLTLAHCNFYGNLVTGNGGGGGAVYISGGTTTLNNDTFYNNSVVGVGDNKSAIGGAIYVGGDGTLFMTNCTVTGNMAKKIASSTDPTNSYARGGGLYLYGHAQILASTFAYNTVVAGVNSTADNAGGGIYLDNTNTTYVQNTIVAANTAPASTDMHSSGSSVLAGFDLIGDGTGSGASNGQYGSQVGTTASPLDVKIGQLASNGGDVKTIALLAGSPAIDAAYNNGPPADARGVARGSTPDIGAYEYEAVPTPTPEPTPTPTPTFTRRPRATVGVSGTAATLSCLASVGDASTLSYAWKLLDKPDHTGSPVLTDAAGRSTDAAFSRAGTYEFRMIVTSDNGEVMSRRLTVRIDAIANGLHIVQHKRTFSDAEPTTMRAFVYDQFGYKLAEQPAIRWALEDGDGSVDADTGVYTPAGHGYAHLVFRATAGDLTGIAGNRTAA